MVESWERCSDRLPRVYAGPSKARAKASESRSGNTRTVAKLWLNRASKKAPGRRFQADSKLGLKMTGAQQARHGAVPDALPKPQDRMEWSASRP